MSHPRSAALALLLALVVAGPAAAQIPGIPSGAGATRPAAASAEPRPERPRAPTAIPVSSISQHATEAERRVDSSLRVLARTSDVAWVRSSVPRILAELAEFDARDPEGELDLDERSLRDALARRLALSDRVAMGRRRLARRGEAIHREQESLVALRATWDATARAIAADRTAPRSAASRVAEVRSHLARAERMVARSTDELLAAQTSLENASDGVDVAVSRIRSLEARAREHLFDAVDPPLWRGLGGLWDARGRVVPFRARPWTLRFDLAYFVEVYRDRLPYAAVLALLVLAGATTISRRTLARTTLPPGEEEAAIFQRPMAAALLLVMVAMRFAFPRATYALFDTTSLLSLVALARLVPVLVTRRELARALEVGIAIFTLHRTWMLLDPDKPWKSYGLLLLGLAMVVALVFVIRRGTDVAARDGSRVQRFTPAFSRLAIAVLSVALLAGLGGRTLLLGYLVDGMLLTTYWLLVCAVLVNVARVFLLAVLGSPRVASLPSMRGFGELIRGRVNATVEVVGVLLWLFAATAVFGVSGPLFRFVGEVLAARHALGTWSISLGDVLAFGVTLYASAKLARFVSFFLELDVLSRMELPRGVAPTTARLTRYAILLVGFVFAFGVSGVDASKLALVVSALSVGIGFGLQNVVNNFVSGLMLIFERPVRVGDIVEIGGLTGEVREIGIRASTIRTLQGADVIVPNSELIANRVVNWTLTDSIRRIDMPIGVAYGSDPGKVIALLEMAARGVHDVATDPKPVAIFLGFGDSALSFEVRLWVRRFDLGPTVKSEANTAFARVLGEAGIEIPFPQRDLHVRSVDPEVRAALGAVPTDGSSRTPGDGSR